MHRSGDREKIRVQRMMFFYSSGKLYAWICDFKKNGGLPTLCKLADSEKCTIGRFDSSADRVFYNRD
jgi:hypothetical protein